MPDRLVPQQGRHILVSIHLTLPVTLAVFQALQVHHPPIMLLALIHRQGQIRPDKTNKALPVVLLHQSYLEDIAILVPPRVKILVPMLVKAQELTPVKLVAT